MLEELERRNYAASTTRAISGPSTSMRATSTALRTSQYQAYLFRERKLQPNTLIQHRVGIRFFYIMTLKQSWGAGQCLATLLLRFRRDRGYPEVSSRPVSLTENA
jgi:hypothetical protein